MVSDPTSCNIVGKLGIPEGSRGGPGPGSARVRDRLKLVHLSDTPREVYRHSAVGEGVVPFAEVLPVLEEVGYRDPPMLEIIADDPDRALRASVERLFELGWPAQAPRAYLRTAAGLLPSPSAEEDERRT